MNTSQLECFITLAGNLNYVKTADELGLTQPAVSRQIQALEKELGAKLFERSTRSVSLSHIGKEFLPEATEILNKYYQSISWISSYHTEVPHSLKIGYHDSLINSLISKLLKPLINENPNISPELLLNQTDVNLNKLTTGQLDILIAVKDAKFKNENIIFEKLHDEKFVCVFSKESKLYEKHKNHNSISTKDLWNYRQIIYIPPYLLKSYFSRGRYIVPVNDDINNVLVSNASEAYALLLANLGYCFIPYYLIQENNELCFIEWEESKSASLGLYYSKEAINDKNSAVYKFILEARNFFTK